MPLTDLLLDAVAGAYLGGFSTRSDYARNNAEIVAQAACEGLITTKNVLTGLHGRHWLVTPKGLLKLFSEVMV
jgi:hypothetical protein